MIFLNTPCPEKTAIKMNDRLISYAELKQEIQNSICLFKKLPKAILVLQAAPTIEFISQFLAALSSNLPVALLSNQWTQQEKMERISILGQAMTINAQGDLLQLIENQSVPIHPQLSLVLFTSGSTGQVKAVQLSLKNIQSNCLAVIQSLRFSAIKDQLLFLPLSYSFGLLGQLLPALLSGISTHLISQLTEIKIHFETGEIPEMWSGVPSHWVAICRMAKHYPQSAEKISTIVSAGAPLAVSLRGELKQLFPNAIIYNNYGLTEASPRILTYSSEDPLFMEPYAGYPIGDWQAKLSDAQELLVKGKQIMLGYLGDEYPSKIQEGWLSTGDLAEIHSTGLIAIKGRLDNIVNIGGEKVNINEIEEKIGRIEGIKEVIIVPVSDSIYGIRLLACFEKASFNFSATEKQLSERIGLHLLPKKLPITVRLIEKIPRNQHGKLDRKNLIANLHTLIP